MEMNELRMEAKDLNNQAELLLKAGKVAEAKEKVERAITLDPMLMENYKNYGNIYMELEEFQNAKNSYKKALLIQKEGEVHFLYGNACFMNNEPNEGLESYNLALNAGFDGEDMMFFMGLAYENMEDKDMALRYFQKAYLKNPSRADYLLKKIGTLLDLGAYDEAEKATDEFLVKHPELFDGYHIKTLILLNSGKNEEAITFAKKASDKFPDDADLMFDYVKAVTLSGKLEEALKEIAIAKEMKYYEEVKRDFIHLEAQIQAEKGDLEKAIESCKECISLEAEGEFDREARFMMMNLYLVKKDYEKSLEQAEEIIARKEENVYYYAALYFRAFCKKELGQKEEAKKLYQDANSYYRLVTLKNPEAVDVYLYRAMCLKDLEEYEKALELLEFISDLNDGIAEVYSIKAEIYHLQGKTALEKEALQKAYERKPELRPVEESEGK